MLGLNYRPLVFEKLGDNLNFFWLCNKTTIMQELFFPWREEISAKICCFKKAIEAFAANDSQYFFFLNCLQVLHSRLMISAFAEMRSHWKPSLHHHPSAAVSVQGLMRKVSQTDHYYKVYSVSSVAFWFTFICQPVIHSRPAAAWWAALPTLLQ